MGHGLESTGPAFLGHPMPLSQHNGTEPPPGQLSHWALPETDRLHAYLSPEHGTCATLAPTTMPTEGSPAKMDVSPLPRFLQIQGPYYEPSGVLLIKLSFAQYT